MMQPGRYLGRNPRGIPDTRGQNNTPFMVVTVEVTHIVANGDWQELPSCGVRDLWLAMSDAAWPYTEKKLVALGFNGDFRAPEFDLSAKDGWVELVCEHQQYEGQTKERWSLASWGDRERTPPADDVMRALTAKWEHGRQQFSERPAPPAPPAMPKNPKAPQAPPRSPAPARADDIPF